MRHTPERHTDAADRTVKDIRRKTRKRYSSEDKIRIVLAGLRGEDTIARSNIRNYSIFLKEPENLLFAYWEYHGTDFAAEAANIAADPETQRRWTLTDPCQEPLTTRKDGEFWAMMEEVFHVD